MLLSGRWSFHWGRTWCLLWLLLLLFLGHSYQVIGAHVLLNNVILFKLLYLHINIILLFHYLFVQFTTCNFLWGLVIVVTILLLHGYIRSLLFRALLWDWNTLPSFLRLWHIILTFLLFWSCWWFFKISFDFFLWLSWLLSLNLFLRLLIGSTLIGKYTLFELLLLKLELLLMLFPLLPLNVFFESTEDHSIILFGDSISLFPLLVEHLTSFILRLDTYFGRINK